MMRALLSSAKSASESGLDLALMGVRAEVGIGAARARASRAAVCGEEEESGKPAARARRVRAKGRREMRRIVLWLFGLVWFGWLVGWLVEGGRVDTSVVDVVVDVWM